MALWPVAGSTNLAGIGKGKRVGSWHLSTTVAAGVINFRNGSAAGPIMFTVNLPVGNSSSQAYPHASEPLFPLGLYVEVTSGTVVGSVDLV
jgi:hypothetical protein